MKVLLLVLSLLLFLTSCSKGDDNPSNTKEGLTYIPDDEFEQWLIDYGHDDKLDDYILTENALKVERLCADEYSVNDFTGIEDFSSLKSLCVYWGEFKSIDLTKNINLEHLTLQGDVPLSKLDLSQNTKLEILDLWGNSFTNINLTNNTELRTINLSGNNLTEFTPLHFEKLVNLSLNDNNIEYLDVSENLLLESISIRNNNIETIQINHLEHLTRLGVEDNKISRLDVSKNQQLTHLGVSGNPVECIKVSEYQLSNNEDDTVLGDWYWYKDDSARYSLNCESDEAVSWTIFNTQNSDIPSNKIIDIEFDSLGDAWMVTEETGFVHYDGSNWISFYDETSDLYDYRLVDIAIDNVDSKWIASRKNGFHWYNNGEWIHYGSSNSDFPSDDLTCIVIDEDQYKWIGSEEGLIKYRGGEWSLYHKDNSLMTSNFVRAINVDSNNKIWFTTENELISIKGNNFEVFSYPKYLPNQNSSIAFRDNEVWIVAGYGIASLINGSWTFYDYFEENSCLTDCQIRTISFENNELWLGNFAECNSGGLQNFDKCNLYTTENSALPHGRILSLNFDNYGNAWVGTDQGLAILKFD